MSAPEPEAGFKVTDRRRRDSVEDPSPLLATPGAPVDRQPPTAATAGIEADTEEEASLSALFMMLANSAVVALGEPDPATGRRHHDPAQAAEIIALLQLLRTKTEGNRTVEETQVLEELLYELQVRYVEAMKQSG